VGKGQQSLWNDEAPAVEPGSPADRPRRQTRERQMRWRRRHQFAPPLVESPDGPAPSAPTREQPASAPVLRWSAPEPDLPPDVVDALARALGEALVAQYRQDTEGDSEGMRDSPVRNSASPSGTAHTPYIVPTPYTAGRETDD
jgi:hypothetical protein